MGVGAGLCIPTLSFPQRREREVGMATGSGFCRSCNINYWLKGVRPVACSQPWPWQLAAEKGSLAELKDKEMTPFIGCLDHRVIMVLLIFQFQSSCDSYFIAQGFFSFPSSQVMCHLIPHLLLESQP